VFDGQAEGRHDFLDLGDGLRHLLLGNAFGFGFEPLRFAF
jgi:hypothetical protein